MKSNHLAIVIPVYLENPSEDDCISIRRTMDVFRLEDIFLTGPTGLNFSNYTNLASEKEKLPVPVTFDPEFFESTTTYNRLLLNAKFYRVFNAYEYMLIVQPDAFVFSGVIAHWMQKNYHYVGAPWIKDISNDTIRYAAKRGGNGGFSLRHVQKSIDVLCVNKVTLSPKESWLYLKKFHTGFQLILRIPLWMLMCAGFRNNSKRFIREFDSNEDVFWSLHATTIDKTFSVAPVAEELDFAWETFGPELFALRNGKLPAGCHAWNKRDREFWIKQIEKYIK